MELNSWNSWADELDRKSVVYLVCFKYFLLFCQTTELVFK